MKINYRLLRLVGFVFTSIVKIRHKNTIVARIKELKHTEAIAALFNFFS